MSIGYTVIIISELIEMNKREHIMFVNSILKYILYIFKYIRHFFTFKLRKIKAKNCQI